MTSCDALFAHLHGFASPEAVVGQHLADLIPSVQLPPPGEQVPEVGPPPCTVWPLEPVYLVTIKFLDPNP